MAVTLLPHTQYTWEDLTVTGGEDSGTLVVTCDNGYKFDGVITLHSNSSGTDYTATSQTNTVVRFEQKYVNRDWVVQGNVISAGGYVTNNVPNSTDNSRWMGDEGYGDYWYLKLNAKSGYKFDGDITATYTDTSGQPQTLVLTPRNAYNLEVWAYVYDTDANTTFVITGNTRLDNEVNIETNFSNCYADPPLPEFLQYGETLNVTIKANENTAFDTEQSTPYFFYYDENGNHASKDLTVSEDKQTATGSLVLQDGWYDVSVNADAYPVAVVGEQYGAINVYLVTLDELAEFSKKRFFKETGSDPETGAAIYENIDLGSYVNKIRRVYTNIGASSTDVIRCGNYNTGVSCHQPAQDKITLDFGTAVVPAHNEDNTDYESEIQIFLPFAGFVTLNTDYAGKTIALQYVINVVTGNGVALLSCNGVVFQVEETEPSSEIIYLSPSTQVKTVGGDDWNEMLYYGLEPYIYCKWYESASNGRNNDRQTGILGDFRGFNVFDDVTPIHTAEMLAEEQEMIYTALSDGVYIE